ncbi:MAG: peptide-methionine (S)-S-oxide reductase MsrA [Eubacteriales bacterium]
MKEIYLAGGCFWGVEEYFARIEGVKNTKVGYANSSVESPTYQQVCTGATNAAETLHLEYDESAIKLEKILDYYFRIIDPISVNKQGNDIGTQYRTGIYYVDNNDADIIKKYCEGIQKEYKQKLAVEIMPLENFFDAEEYHQRYLKKNPNGYCHIDLSAMED